ncbi:hypothetical protein BKA66DRAFT_454314 [Pyrenochaeta sp. MPI-SDFR-AT-0127]|nr:hypothetical protein BKA66DRAFT_454314 [Pyrenochaeta sp. MPI-SDFR-AT-0127]
MFPSFTRTYHNRPYPSISPHRSELSAAGKVVLITGSGSGIGQATAITFAQAGASVIIVSGRRLGPLEETKRKINALGQATQVIVCQLDICDERNVTEVFGSVRQTIGEIDVVINGAGYLAEPGNIKDIDLNTFWNSFEVHVKGSFNIARAFLNHTTPSISRPKVLILLSSGNALLPAPQIVESRLSPASYGISKLAEAKLAEYISAENPSHFRAYALQPGIVETGMSSKSIEMTADPEGIRKSLTWDEPELSAGFMLWLSSRIGECVPSGRFLFANWDVDELEETAGVLEKDANLLTMGCVGWPFDQK